MRKSNLFMTLATLILAFVVNIQVIADSWITFNNQQQQKTEIKVDQATQSSSIITFKINAYKLENVQTPAGQAVIVKIPKATPMLMAGFPDLPKISRSIIIPADGVMAAEVISSDYFELDNINVAPSKGNLLRTVNPDEVAYTYNEIYTKNEFFPSQITGLNEPYIIRDFRGQTIVVNPVQYNPVSRKLRIYKTITVKITQVATTAPAFHQPDFPINAEYNEIYKHHFLNYDAFVNKYTPISENGRMLIITHDAFASAMTPFIEWKTLKGMQVQIVNVSTIGVNANSIKTYVTNYYNTNGLTFLLLIGDAAQIPPLYKSGDSDAAYGHVVGTDSYAEFFVGRFSAENIAQVETQVQRVLTYEKTPLTSFDFYSKYVGIGSSQGAGQGDDGEADYTHIHNQIIDLQGFNYTGGNEMYDGSQGGADLPGDPTAAMVSAALNDGRGIITYCGHGSDNSFVTTGFSSSDVNNLVNDNKLPFIFSVACVNGNFVGQTCFAEAWMRATHNNTPSGAIAIIASTINQSWAPPMAGQDEMVDLLVNSYPANIKRTFGGITINGCMRMNDDYPSGGAEMTDTWTIFGDPSIVLRTAMPAAMAVTYNPVFFIGLNQFTLECDTEGALVSLTSEGQIVGTGIVNNGSVTITIQPFTNVTTLNITVTALNKIPHLGSVQVLPNNAAWITINNYLVNDFGNNGKADYGETFGFDLNMKNVGSKPANGLTAVLTTHSQYVTIENGEYNFGMIDSNQVADFSDIFSVRVADSIPDQFQALFTMTMHDANDSIWTTTLKVTLNGPSLSLSAVSINDQDGGNNNTRINPGEIIKMAMRLENTGHAPSAANAMATLTTTNPFIQIVNPVIDVNSFENMKSVVYTLLVSPQIPDGSAIEFNFNFLSGLYRVNETVYQQVGTTVEDFETGNFKTYAWDTTRQYSWTLTNTGTYEGNWSAKSAPIGNNQKSELRIILNVTMDDVVSFYSKVSSEHGGTMYYDYLDFSIDGTSLGKWGGEVAWGFHEFPVTLGTHLLSWKYKKNETGQAGQDCAWLDMIKLPAHENPFSNPDNYIVFESQPDTLARALEAYHYDVELGMADINSPDTSFTLSVYEGPEWFQVSPAGKGRFIIGGTPSIDQQGLFKVILLASNGKLFAHQSFNLFVKWPSAINDQVLKNTTLNVVPNPADNFINIIINASAKAIVDIEIFDVLGNKIAVPAHHLTLQQGEQTIGFNTEKLPKGMYFVKITHSKLSKTAKLIIK